MYLPTLTLDKVAEEQNFAPPVSLGAHAAAAIEDPVLAAMADTLVSALEATHSVTGPFFEQVMSAFLTRLLQRLGECRPGPAPAKGGLAAWQLRRAQKLFLAHLARRISLATVAAECGLSTGYFASAFASSTGLPPHRWLVQRRVERAKELLRGSDQAIAIIAAECGFADQAHMTRVFAKAEGSTPARWRRTHRP